MPEGPDGKTIIIVKKVSGHGGHHGGAWKVAYADFVTAMMALFMVLWLVNSAAVPTRQRIASYFREPGVFDSGSGTPLEQGGAGILPDAFSPPSDENSRVAVSEKLYEVDSTKGKILETFDPSAADGEKQKVDLEKLAKEIKKAINEADGGAGEGQLLGQVDVKVDQQGLHIEIMDTDEASMFEIGRSEIRPVAEAELSRIAAILKKLPNPIDIEGHTDATPFGKGSGRKYDNWDLSTDRANSARRALLRSGIKETQLARVVGFAAQRLKVPTNPIAPSNRRISISMRFTEMAAASLKGTQAKPTVSTPVKLTTEPPKPVEGPQADAKAPVVAELLNSKKGSGLTVSVDTTPQVEPPIENTPAPKAAPEPGARPVWMEKDKIFGGDNPFFSKE